MDWKWHVGLRQPDKSHQEIRKMLRRGIGPGRIGSHDNLIEDCCKELVLNFGNLQGDPTPTVAKYVQNHISRLRFDITKLEK